MQCAAMLASDPSLSAKCDDEDPQLLTLLMDASLQRLLLDAGNPNGADRISREGVSAALLLRMILRSSPSALRIMSEDYEALQSIVSMLIWKSDESYRAHIGALVFEIVFHPKRMDAEGVAGNIRIGKWFSEAFDLDQWLAACRYECITMDSAFSQNAAWIHGSTPDPRCRAMVDAAFSSEGEKGPSQRAIQAAVDDVTASASHAECIERLETLRNICVLDPSAAASIAVNNGTAGFECIKRFVATQPTSDKDFCVLLSSIRYVLSIVQHMR